MSTLLPPEILALRSKVNRCLAMNDIGAALDAVRGLADSVITNPRAVTRVLGSRELDELCETIAAATEPEAAKGAAQYGGTLILASKLVGAGGHVELIKDFIALRLFDEPEALLLTNSFGDSDGQIAEAFSASQGIRIETALGHDASSRFNSVRHHLAQHAPRTLVIVVNNNDIVGICAALASDIENLIFIHHGDHHLSLGVTCERFRHVDLANMAYQNCRHELGVRDNIYWPLILRKDVDARQKEFNKDRRWRSCSVGRAEKFAANGYAFDYARLLPEILKATGGTHVHIGPVPNSLRDAIEKNFAESGVPLDRITFISYAPSVAQALIDEDIDLFIGSFPTGGGKSTIEAMAAGIPLLMHQNYLHRMFCGADVAYPGALTWQTEEELFKAIAGLSADKMSDHARRSRAWFEKHHSREVLRSAVRDHSIVPPPLVEHRVNSLFSFLDEEREISAQYTQRLKQAVDGRILHLETVAAAIEAKNAELQTAKAQLEAKNTELQAAKAELVDKLTSPRKLVRELARQINRRLHGKGPR